MENPIDRFSLDWKKQPFQMHYWKFWVGSKLTKEQIIFLIMKTWKREGMYDL